ncbi:hypothetical protein [Methanosarcina sp. UBA5]|uniref:hypothetical protein n=1 Tax=Methanosarcina sp. UBA5 TaxID=1915593 RepID=UPI0025F16D8C|nr:hypothetical protein [Methanosarcina sp. UBA5]
MKTGNNNAISSSNLLTRDSLLKANSELIGHLQNRLRAKRFRPQEGDGIKLAYMRVFIQALQVQNSILKDSELEELQRRLEALENMQAGSHGGEQFHNVHIGEQSEYVE